MGQIDAPYRERYVERLRHRRVLASPSVERALLEVPLHRFVDQIYLPDEEGTLRRVPYQPGHPDHKSLELIYSGDALVLAVERNRPVRATPSGSAVAQMFEGLELEPGMSVLEIGTGTGYTAALLARLVGSPACVSTTDSDPGAVEQARNHLIPTGFAGIDVSVSDGLLGDPARAPYDRILVTVGCPDISPCWLDQLRPDGLLIAPLEHGGWYPIVRVWKQGGRVRGRIAGSAGVVIPRIEGKLGEHGPGRSGVRELDPSVRESPVWPRLLELPLRDFWFYLAIRSSESCVLDVTDHGRRVARGLGLCLRNGRWSIVVSGRYRLLGHLEALAALEEAYNEWEALGTPRMTDYEMEFVPSDGRPQSHPTWNLARRFFRQTLWLEERGET